MSKKKRSIPDMYDYTNKNRKQLEELLFNRSQAEQEELDAFLKMLDNRIKPGRTTRIVSNVSPKIPPTKVRNRIKNMSEATTNAVKESMEMENRIRQQYHDAINMIRPPEPMEIEAMEMENRIPRRLLSENLDLEEMFSPTRSSTRKRKKTTRGTRRVKKKKPKKKKKKKKRTSKN